VLGQRQSVPAGNLSGGEQQILAIVPMLVHRADVVIADEADPWSCTPEWAAVVIEMFAEICRQGSAVLLVGESPGGLIEIASQAALLHNGELLWSGPADALEREQLTEAYFGAAQAK